MASDRAARIYYVVAFCGSIRFVSCGRKQASDVCKALKAQHPALRGAGWEVLKLREVRRGKQ